MFDHRLTGNPGIRHVRGIIDRARLRSGYKATSTVCRLLAEVPHSGWMTRYSYEGGPLDDYPLRRSFLWVADGPDGALRRVATYPCLIEAQVTLYESPGIH